MFYCFISVDIELHISVVYPQFTTFEQQLGLTMQCTCVFIYLLLREMYKPLCAQGYDPKCIGETLGTEMTLEVTEIKRKSK